MPSLSADIQYIPYNTISLDETEDEDFQKMIGALNDLPEVLDIVHNAKISEETPE